MEADPLEHLSRIASLLQRLAALGWLGQEELGRIEATLLDFDACHWPIVRVLSLPLYSELTALLADPAALALLAERPRLAVVVPVHAPRRELLIQALSSLRRQVGVAIECLISIDGRAEDQALVEELLAGIDAGQAAPMAVAGSGWSARVLVSPRNRGVGLCRNRALRELTAPLFTCLDADDIFHPLRCLHALLLLQLHRLDRLNTGWCRASLLEKKILLINERLAHVGHNSFIARRELLETCGYQADLRVAEDTEFMQRHRHYGVPMLDSAVVGHYLHSEPRADYVSLATPCRREVYAIHEHPYLCGSVLAHSPDDWMAILLAFQDRYRSLPAEQLGFAFPPEPAASQG